MLKITIADTDWTITAQAAEFEANDETPEQAREMADMQEVWLINNSREHLPSAWRYVGNGVFEGPVIGTDLNKIVDVIGSLQIEACDYAVGLDYSQD